MMPLTMAPVGQASKIQRVGGNDETKRFLANLGFAAPPRCLNKADGSDLWERRIRR